MDLVLKYKMLYQIAAKDPVYQVWKKSYDDISPVFDAYAASQPEDIQRLLLGYMDAWKMMQQKMVSLACAHMDFPGEAPSHPERRKKFVRKT